MEKRPQTKVFLSKAEKVYRQFVLNQKALCDQPSARIGGL
jgi:hypothetical protein